MEYEAITNVYLALKIYTSIYILGNKKIRVGRVIVNEHLFLRPQRNLRSS